MPLSEYQRDNSEWHQRGFRRHVVSRSSAADRGLTVDAATSTKATVEKRGFLRDCGREEDGSSAPHHQTQPHVHAVMPANPGHG